VEATTHRKRRAGAGCAKGERLDALRRYDMLDTPPEEAFDRLTRLAAACFDAPIALVSLVGAERQWAKSCFGAERREFARTDSFCAVAIQSEDVTVALDATEDPRFADNPLVTGEEARIRFYAGAPLVTPEGHALGTLCVIDVEARAAFGPEQQARLEDLAATAMDEMERRRVEAQHRETEEALRRSEKRARKLIEHSSDALAVMEADGTIRHQSAASEHIAGRTPEETAGTSPFERMHPGDRERVRAAFESLVEHPDEVMNVRYRTYHSKEDRWVHIESVGRNLLDEPAVEGIVVNSRDVTERREREEHLRLMDAVMAQAEDGVLITEAHSLGEPGPKITYVNDTFCENIGYAREEVLGRNPCFLQGPETDRAELERLRAALEAEEPVRVELINYKKDRTPFWVEMSAMPIFDAEGRCTHFSYIQRDVSERKAREDALAESEARFREIAETVTQAFWILEPGGTLRYVSPAFEEIWERSREVLSENPSRLWLETIHPDDRERVRDWFASERSLEEHDLQYRIVRPSGEVRWVRSRGYPMRNEEGKAERLIGVAEDITERKHAEAALEKSEERFRKLVEHSSDIVTIQNADGTIRYESPAVNEVLGLEPSNASGERPVDFVHPDDAEQMHALREKLFRNPGEVVTARFRLQHADGHWVPIEAVAKNMLDDPVVRGIVVHSRDVTDTVRYEAERAARQRAEELLEAKTTFLNNMSHELRTPLASILGFAEVLAEEGEGDQQEFAGRIAESGKRLQQTLESILRLAKLDAEGDEGALQLEPTDVTEVAYKAASTHHPAAEEKGLTLTVERPPEEEDAPRAMADAGALNRVLDNLLSNAVKFTEEGGVAVRVETGPQQVLLCVEDTGIGISEDFQEQLFADFTQESTGLGRTHEGSGLGMAITQRLVQMMDGTVEVDSACGEGTTFTVRLPRPAADGEEPASEDADPGEEEAPGASPAHGKPAPPPREKSPARLLVVEDNPNTRALAEHVLGSRYDVQCATGAEDALARVQDATAPFDLFLIDISLGSEGEDGVGLLRRLRSGDRAGDTGAPAVAFTAHAMPGDAEHYRDAGFEGYLAKPFDRSELRETVEATLARAGAEKSASS
jgi:PAS domain S-box-containing protein